MPRLAAALPAGLELMADDPHRQAQEQHAHLTEQKPADAQDMHIYK